MGDIVLIGVRSNQRQLALPVDPNLHFTLKVLVALLAILLASALCGRLALAVKQPRVLGEMIAGVLLGPTLLGQLAPRAEHVLFPADVKPALYMLSTLGLTLYMFLVGVGFDSRADGIGGGEARGGEARRAAVLAVSGVAPSLLLGAGAGLVVYRQLSPPDVSPAMFALFVGGALSVTAFPMLARILYERRIENSRIGKLALLAAAVDDAVAWCFLAFLTAVHAGSGPAAAARTLALGALFAAVMLLVVAPLLRPMGARVARTGNVEPGQMYLVALIVLGAGWFTDWIGIYSVFGGFIAGVAMPRNPEFREALHGRMMDFVSTFLVPVFFAFSGLNTVLSGFTRPEMLLALLATLGAGFAGKYLGCGLAARAVGLSWRESWSLGALMNARGLMILIFINIGLAQHIISQKIFSVLVLVAVITTGVAVPLFRRSMPRRLPGTINSRPPPSRHPILLPLLSWPEEIVHHLGRKNALRTESLSFRRVPAERTEQSHGKFHQGSGLPRSARLVPGRSSPGVLALGDGGGRCLSPSWSSAPGQRMEPCFTGPRRCAGRDQQCPLPPGRSSRTPVAGSPRRGSPARAGIPDIER
ncbi:hypothetical protein GXW82_10595 [Streptacidiphilus sp. 4-A2]|nr:hypothetical protein [Streptacidiphilus sp. 4-A2]